MCRLVHQIDDTWCSDEVFRKRSSYGSVVGERPDRRRWELSEVSQCRGWPEGDSVCRQEVGVCKYSGRNMASVAEH